MADKHDEQGIDRRGALECMVWAGTGLLWTFAGGVPKVSQILGVTEANAQAATGFTFAQISGGQGQTSFHDSHRRHFAFVKAERI
jgi:hypothetical protein